MAAEKIAFEAHAAVNQVELGKPDGSLLRLEPGKPFETNDPALIRALDDHPHVKRAGKAPAAKDGEK